MFDSPWKVRRLPAIYGALGFPSLRARSHLPESRPVRILGMAYFLGIDGGGTKTRSIVGDEDSELGAGSSGSSKVQRVGVASARGSLSAAIHQACLQAGISPREIARTSAGVTGAGRPEIAAVIRELISSVAGGEIEISTDVDIAFEDAFGSDPGILVIAGTGAIALGRNSRGQTARAGGLGFPVSDEGSGYWIGVEAVRLVLHARDRGENPALLNLLMAGLGAKDFDDFIVRANHSPSPDFSTLSPIVLSSANGGDSLAREVLDRAGGELGRMAAVVATRLFQNGACPVATHGGVLASSEIVRSRFEGELRSQVPGAVLLERAVDPARGALGRARRAFQAAGAQ
ncbi:MAG: hypothetical protein J2P13_02385 [Acidobacteria bacterium]|nr:hypothetical protein [Acidobacteriota bacterium]